MSNNKSVLNSTLVIWIGLKRFTQYNNRCTIMGVRSTIAHIFIKKHLPIYGPGFYKQLFMTFEIHEYQNEYKHYYPVYT